MATRDYTLGKGKVLFKKAGNVGYTDLGNAPAFTVSVTVDKLEHLSSRSGLSVKDLEVITKLGMAGSFTLDEPNAENLAMFVMSADGVTAAAQGAGSTVADAITSPVVGQWYPLTIAAGATKTNSAVTADVNNIGTAVGTLSGTQTANATNAYTVRCSLEGASGAAEVQTRLGTGAWSAAIPVTDATNFNVLNVAADTGLDFQIDACANLKKGDEFTFSTTYTPAASGRISNILTFSASGKVEGTDYTLDYAAGLIMPLTAGTITPTATTYAANAGKTTTTGGDLTSLAGDIYFVGDPPQGRVIDVMGHCNLTPNGDWSLIGTDWMQMQFNIEFLKVDGVDGLVHLTDRGKAGQL